MKKQVIVILLFVVLSAMLHWGIGIFNRYNPITAYWDKINDNVQIIYYGEFFRTDSLKSVFAKRYFGFNFHRIEDCKVNTPFVHGVEGYNKIMSKAISAKWGADWEERLDALVENCFLKSTDDSLFISNTDVVFIIPDSSEIRIAKLNLPEKDYDAVLDDQSFYNDQARTLLDSLSIKYSYTEKRYVLMDGILIDTDTTESDWCIVWRNRKGIIEVSSALDIVFQLSTKGRESKGT